MQRPPGVRPDTADCDSPPQPRDVRRPPAYCGGQTAYVTGQTRISKVYPRASDLHKTVQRPVRRKARWDAEFGETGRRQWRRGTSREGTRAIDPAACSMQV